MSILAYLTGFVLGAGWVLILLAVRERRIRREHAAETARLTGNVKARLTDATEAAFQRGKRAGYSDGFRAGRDDVIGTDTRTCTCDPDDNPPRPCQRKFALTQCRAAAGVGGTDGL